MSDTPQNNQATDQGHIPDDPLTGHLYDGIQEFDNPMPGWWKMLFWGSILYSVGYWLFYHNGITPERSTIASYDRAVAANLQKQFAELGELQADRETILKYVDDPKWLTVGRTVFQGNCTQCHGPEGGGKNGPNLTDDKWKNVKQVTDIAQVIKQGAAGNAMPAWQTKLHPNEVVLVSSYVLSLQGTLPAGAGKPPIEGENKVIGDLDLAADAASDSETVQPPAEEPEAADTKKPKPKDKDS